MWFLQADLASAFGPIRDPLIWKVLARRVGGSAAAEAFLMASIGHAVVPHWVGMAGDRTPNFKGCKQGLPESPALWNLILDEALGPLRKECQSRGCGVKPSCTRGGFHREPHPGFREARQVV